jgi:hypothetical protein
MKKYFTKDENNEKDMFDFRTIIPVNFEGRITLESNGYSWGTKWNAIDLKFNDFDNFSFLTAWSTPNPIYIKLSELEPELIFSVMYADEYFGYNFGKCTTQKGKIKWESIKSQGQDDSCIAKKIWFDDRRIDNIDEL